jgi:2-polyprenyl-3-methyl-5-hydroxy-6-metoxy-1,4-benzoquinol methylase
MKYDQWDKVAEAYSRIEDDLRKIYLYPAVEESITKYCSGAISLLDYGCGSGDLALRLLPHFRTVALTDTSQKALAIARQRLAECARIFTSGELANSGCRYDVVLLALVLTTIANDADLIATFCTIHSLLNPGGRCLIATTHPCFTFTALQNVPYRKSGGAYQVSIGPGVEVVEYHRPLSHLFNLISRVGFRMINLEEVYDDPAYYIDRGETPPRFSGILPMFLILICESESSEIHR